MSSAGATTSRKTPPFQISKPSGERMQKWMRPPGRRSIVQWGVVQPFGPHQRAKRSGSVLALVMCCCGASKTRVIVSSRSGVGLEGLRFAAIFLRFQLAQIVLQAIEAALDE